MLLLPSDTDKPTDLIAIGRARHAFVRLWLFGIFGIVTVVLGLRAGATWPLLWTCLVLSTILLECLIYRFLRDNADWGSQGFRASVVSGVFGFHHIVLILIAALIMAFPELTVDKMCAGIFIDPNLPEIIKRFHISVMCVIFMALYTRGVLQNALLEPDLSLRSFRVTVICAESINFSLSAIHAQRLMLVVDFTSPGALYGLFCLIAAIGVSDILLATGKNRLDQFHAHLVQDKHSAETELRLSQELEIQNRLRATADMQARAALTQAKEAEARTKAEQQLQAYLSHEVRNPLNVITHTLSFALNKIDALGDKKAGGRSGGTKKQKGDDKGNGRGTDRDSSRENDTKQLREWCTNALSSADYVLDLLNNLLDLSRLEDGNLQLCQAPVCLQTLCKNIQHQLSSAVQPGVTLQVVVEPLGGVIVGDELRLRQMLYNLLSNALKFTSTGWVRLTVCHESHLRELSIEVADTGIGISAEEKPQLFEKYHQIRHKQVAKQKQQTGTGLGLAIAQQIAVLMHSRIHVTSPHRHHRGGKAGRSSVSNSGSNGSKGSVCGSLFSLRIPDVECASSSSGNDDTEEQLVPDLTTLSPKFDFSALRGLQVLLVDDEPLNLMILRALLQQSPETTHYEIACDTASSGEEALFMTLSGGDSGNCSCPYDVIVLDQHLGNSGGKLLGTEVSTKLRKSWQSRRPPLTKKPVLIICSGNCTPADTVRYQESGADLVWPKPVPSASHMARDLALALQAREGSMPDNCFTSLESAAFSRRASPLITSSRQSNG
jgi:signal transduction histidine kinase/DNA-binding response OmpR family regulator